LGEEEAGSCPSNADAEEVVYRTDVLDGESVVEPCDDVS